MHSLHVLVPTMASSCRCMLLERRDYVASLVKNNRSHKADSRKLWGPSPRGSAKGVPTNDVE